MILELVRQSSCLNCNSDLIELGKNRNAMYCTTNCKNLYRKIKNPQVNYYVSARTMAPALERNKILTFHTASVSDSILDAGKFIFGTNVKVRDEARRDAEYAWNTLGAKTASIFFIATDFGEDYNKHFTIRFEELGGMSRSPFFEHIVLNQ